MNNLSNAVKVQSNSSNMLSSGNRLYSSKNDSAGLSISEKMKSQIRGLSQANRNSQDGISLVQTAEGALQEVHSMLQRMRTLSVQSVNGTYTDNDREIINAEISELLKEIDKISDTTEFNKQKLLGGSSNSSGITTISIYGLSRNLASDPIYNAKNGDALVPTTPLSNPVVYTSLKDLEDAGCVTYDTDGKTVITLNGDVTLKDISLDDKTIIHASGNARLDNVTTYGKIYATDNVTLENLHGNAVIDASGNTKLVNIKSNELTNTTIYASGKVTLENIEEFMTNSTIICKEGIELTINNVGLSSSLTPYSAIKFTGKNNVLIVEGSNRLVGGYEASAINVNENTELTIKGTGFLRAEGNEGSAGIGGGKGEACGTITIESSTIEAQGGYEGSGIGGGKDGSGGNVTISGGTVNAYGNGGGSGIGGGKGGSGGTVAISGGSVTTTGGYGGAGIGGGSGGVGGDVTISGGSVTSTGGTNGAGIGGGSSESGGNVIISGGTINITGGTNGAGIGGGSGGSGGTVDIDQNNSTGSATGGTNAPGIGAGNGGSNHGTITNDNGSMSNDPDKKYHWPYTAPITPPSGGGGTGGSGGTGGTGGSGGTGGNTGGGSTGGSGNTGGSTGGSSTPNNQGIKLQIGANQGNILMINIDTINTNTLGISNLSVKTTNDAEASIDIIDKAIEKVSNERSRLGAYKNVLDVTTNYLNYTEENMQASQSRIADANFATEVLSYAKSNILIQAGQAMIAQNKQNTSNVLALLN